jgi:hypothetical protein
MSSFCVASSYVMLTGGRGGGGSSGAGPLGPVAATLARASDYSGTSEAKSPVCVRTICQR